MGLTRSSSGLLVYDAFGSDTIGNYVTTGTISIGSGVITLTDGNVYAVHGSTSGAFCLSCAAKSSGTSYTVGLYLSDNADPTNTADRDGYFFRNGSPTNMWQLYKLDSNTASLLGTSDHDVDDNAVVQRLYRSGNSVIGRGGTTALDHNVSVTDTAFTTTLYGGLRHSVTSSSAYADNFEARTSHTITCTGMTTGHYLRVSDGTTTAEAQESSGTATVDAGAVLFPLATVQIRTAAAGGGDLIAELDTGDYADMGGGDAFAYSSASAKPIWLFKTQYIPQLGGCLRG